MAEIVDFGLQQHKIKMDSRYFENVLSVVAGDTGRRIEVQLLDTNGTVQDTTGLNLRLNAEISGKATYTDATLVDAATGKYQLDLSNGMFLAPGNWQFQWQITDSAGKKLHSFAFTGNIGKNISEGGSQATNFYLNLEDLKAMQEDLVNGTIDSSILETNITEKLTNLETQYAPKLTEVTAQLAQIALNVKDFGAKGDGVNDDTVSIQNAYEYAFNNNIRKIIIPEGKYIITSSIKLNREGVIIEGFGEKTVIQNNGSSYGFLVSKKIVLKDLKLVGNPNSDSGIFIENGTSIKGVLIYQHKYGIEFTKNKHVISTYIDEVTVAYNRLGGLFCDSTGTSQKNLIAFNRLYAVKNGINVDDVTALATPEMGHGVYINGGLDISMTACVAEYNTGAGIYLDEATGYALFGLDMKGTYYEQNKYANLLINYTGANWKSIDSSGSSFSNPFPIVANSVIPTLGDVAYLSGIKPLRKDIHIEGSGLTSDQLEINTSSTSLKPNEIFDFSTFPYNKMGRVTKNHPKSEGLKCLVINSELGNFLEYGVDNFLSVNPYIDYLIEIEYKLFLDGVGNGSFGFNRRTATADNTVSGTNMTVSPPESPEVFIKRKYIYKSNDIGIDTRKLQMKVEINNGLSTNAYFIVKSVTVFPINAKVIISGKTSERPNRVQGLEYFDTTLNKPIWANATGWVDSTGTSV